MKNMLTMRWIGQGGYLFSDGKTSIAVDPYLSDVVNRVAGRPRMVQPPFQPEQLRCDAVVCTHNHLDHVDTDAIPSMPKEHILFLAPSDAEATLRSCGVTNYRNFDVGESVQLGDFTLRAVFADHTVPAIGLLLCHGDRKIYLSGDTEYHEKLKELASIDLDIAIICINGRLGNMNVEQAVSLTRSLHPKVAIPTHYGMFLSNTENPDKYTSALECGVELMYNQEYYVEELMRRV